MNNFVAKMQILIRKNKQLRFQNDNLRAACKQFAKGWPHFCDCIDFGQSALDAEAIFWMNNVPPMIIAATHEANKTKKEAPV